MRVRHVRNVQCSRKLELVNSSFIVTRSLSHLPNQVNVDYNVCTLLPWAEAGKKKKEKKLHRFFTKSDGMFEAVTDAEFLAVLGLFESGRLTWNV